MKKILFWILITTLVFALFSIPAFASESLESAQTNVFEEIYNKIIHHSDKIFSALAFCSSMILAFAYRKGILPLIKGGLGALNNTVTGLKKEAEKSTVLSAEAASAAAEKLGRAEEVLITATEKLCELEKELSTAEQIQAQNEDIKIIMQSQIDMLYEIFMSSSIPLYQKEAVGAKVNAMKKLLERSEVENDD